MRGSGIRAVGGIGNQHRAAARTGGAVAGIEKRPDHHDARHLAMCAGGRLQRNTGQAGDLRETLLQLVNHLQRALNVGFIRQRMKVSKARDARDALVQTRVVFHRARTERIHPDIDRVVPSRHANEVTHDVDFADFRHAGEIVVTLELFGDEIVERRFVDVERGQSIADASGLRTFEDQLLVRTDVTGYFRDAVGHSSLNAETSASICSRVFVSVTQTRKSLARSGMNRDSAMPPSISFSLASCASSSAALPGARTTNSLKRGPEKGSEKPFTPAIRRAAYAAFCTHCCAAS